MQIMSDIIEEAKIDYREEKKLQYFKRSLPWVIGFTVLLIIGMVWNDYRSSKLIAHNRQMGDMLIKAMEVEGKDHKAAMEALEYLQEKSANGIADLASLEKIHHMIQKGDVPEALGALEALAASSALEFTKSYAKVTWMSLMIDKSKLSEDEKQILASYLKDFDNDDKEFFGTAKVLGALFSIKNDRAEEAKISLRQVTGSDKVPSLVKNQALEVLANLNI
jgi:hypothetical protein